MAELIALWTAQPIALPAARVGCKSCSRRTAFLYEKKTLIVCRCSQSLNH